MGAEVDRLPEGCGTAEHFRRFEQRLAEIDGAIAQLGERIRGAEQTSKYVIREEAPAFDDEEPAPATKG